MNPEAFLEAFGKAKRHSYVPYAQGVGCVAASWPSTAMLAWRLYKDGRCVLFQRRVPGTSTFDYLVFKLR